MKVALEPKQEQFVKLQIHQGRYATAEQVISSALKLLEERQRQGDEKRLEELRQKIAVGTEQIQRGQVTDGEVVFARLLRNPVFWKNRVSAPKAETSEKPGFLEKPGFWPQ